MGEKNIMRILVVDDNIAIHEDFKRILIEGSEAGDAEEQELSSELFENDLAAGPIQKDTVEYQIDDAFQGIEAIQMVDLAAKQRMPYSLIFMDVRMPPGIDGIVAIKEIWKRHPEIEMVLCTAFSDYSWEKIQKKLGRTDHLLFLRKPCDAVSIQQIALALTVKWELRRQNKNYMNNLEAKIAERTKELELLVKEKEKYISAIKDELELAERAQRRFLPRRLPPLSRLTSAVQYLPTGNVGGDYYNITQLNEKEIAILIFDVSGHGVGAALICAFAKSSFDFYLRECRNPREVFTKVNAELCSSILKEMYLTGFLMYLNTDTGEARYCNAGHVPPILFRGKDQTIDELLTAGSFIGMIEEATFAEKNVTLESGDRLCFFTDGLTETFNGEDQMFGRDGLKQVILENGTLEPKELLEKIIAVNDAFIEGKPRGDDLCLLTLGFS